MAELFGNFEINKVPRWPLMSRLLTASLVVHGLFFVAVIYLPTVQSMFRVAGSFAGVKFVEHDYDETLIGERATLVKLSEPYQKLYYPSDYFGVPTVLDPTAQPAPVFVQQVAPPAPAVFRPRPAPRPRFRPTPQPTPLASATPAATPTPEIAKTNDQKSGGALTPEEVAKSEAELNKVAGEHNVARPPAENEVNLKPLKDVLKTAKQMLADGKIDLNKTIDMTVEADLKEDGTLENAEITNQQGDENLRDLAKTFVSRLGASAVLKFLNEKQVDVRHLIMTVKIDGQEVKISVTAQVASEDRATEMARGYGGMIGGKRLFKQGKDEDKLWDNMNVNADGKQVIMQFQMPRDTAGELLGKVKAEG